ncbi:MAG: hypothetical protein QOD37_1246 [Gaiellales bacterium]|nr:hypothetical protein [Gaiellales bacterium]
MLRLLHEKLAEAHGLAIASARVCEAASARIESRALQRHLRHMRRESDESRVRCLRIEETLGAAIAEDMRVHAIMVDGKASDVAHAWLDAGTDPLRAWLLVAMSEGAELAEWRAVAALAAAGRDSSTIRELASWALAVQERHVSVALDGAATLARSLARNER